jgi:hypothetical protein
VIDRGDELVAHPIGELVFADARPVDDETPKCRIVALELNGGVGKGAVLVYTLPE